MKVNTTIWSENGEVNPKLKKDNKGLDYWGNLYGSRELLTPHPPTTKREFHVEWNNVGKTAKKNYTNGNDLVLVKNAFTA